VRRIVTRCLKKDTAARYASGAELARDLKLARDAFPDSGTGLQRGPQIAVEVKRPRFWFLPVVSDSCHRRHRLSDQRSRDATPPGRAHRSAGDFATLRSRQVRPAFTLRNKRRKQFPVTPRLAKLCP